MDDSLALDSEPSHAVIAHSSPPLPSSPSNAPFNLVGLPYELQRKIILDAWYAAIQLGDTSDWLAMLGVKAFECIVAPDHWAVSESLSVQVTRLMRMCLGAETLGS